MIHTISERTSWLDAGVNEILPHLVRKTLERPKMNRRREVDEVPAHSKRYKM